MSKIKWYDWVLAILVADLITVILFSLLSQPQNTFLWISLGVLVDLWNSGYCSFRRSRG